MKVLAIESKQQIFLELFRERQVHPRPFFAGTLPLRNYGLIGDLHTVFASAQYIGGMGPQKHTNNHKYLPSGNLT